MPRSFHQIETAQHPGGDDMVRRRAGWRRSRRSGWAELGLASLLTLASATSGAAQGYNTNAFVASGQNECRGVPNCVTDAKPAVGVSARTSITARFTCPDHHPNLWRWDVGQHEHIAVKLLAMQRHSVTVEGTSLDRAAGSFVVFLGCSTAPYAGAPVLKSRQLAPTGWTGNQVTR